VSLSNLPTPGTIVERARNPNDSDARERLLAYSLGYLWRVASRTNVPISLREELVQDVGVIVLERIKDFEYDRNRSYRAWLKTLFMNRLFEHHRRGKYRELNSLPLIEEPASPEVDNLERQEYLATVANAALGFVEKQYSDRDRRIFTMVVIECKEPEAVAKEMATSVDNVYKVKSRILIELRKELQGIVEPGDLE
jgi:RNA polymerase sigma factor (sigma-70 family)